MFGLSHLFYPWGILLQIMTIVHFVKRRPENYWLWIILIGGPIGASAYLLVEVAPDARLLGGVFQGFGRRSRIQTLEVQILDNPSAGNYEELGELNLEEKKYEKARWVWATMRARFLISIEWLVQTGNLIIIARGGCWGAPMQRRGEWGKLGTGLR